MLAKVYSVEVKVLLMVSSQVSQVWSQSPWKEQKNQELEVFLKVAWRD